MSAIHKIKPRILLAGAATALLALQPQVIHAQEAAGEGNPVPNVCDDAQALAWFDSDWVCTASGRGLALALPGQAEQLAGTLDEAVADFESYFGASDYNFAVLSTPSLPSEAIVFLKERGFLTLPWITEASRGNLIRLSVERQVNEQTKGMSEEQRAAILAQALEQVGSLGASAPQPPSAVELGALAHEAGHILFREFYDGDEIPSESVSRYGSSSPDWIDELAAVLNENSELTDGRYASARKRVEEGENANPFPLEEFFEMEHPSLRAAQALRERSGQSGENVTLILSGEEAQQFLAESRGDPAEFYLQTRLFADFMLETTGDQRIFAKVANGFKEQGSFAQWLASNHKAFGLAEDIDGLETQFAGWIEQRLAKED